MKRNQFVAFLSLLLIAWFSLFLPSCKPPGKPCCDLPAPQNLTDTVLSPTSVKLDWDAVAGAQGYRVQVFDVTADTAFGDFNAPADSLILTGLAPSHGYTAIVEAICKDGQPSPNASAVCFDMLGVIVVDTDVMRDLGTGMMEELCTCKPGKTHLLTPGIYTNPVDLDLTYSPTRAILYCKVGQGNSPYHEFKLAFDQGCLFIKYRGEDCPHSTAEIELVNNSQILVSLGFSTLGLNRPSVRVTPGFDGSGDGKLDVNFSPNCLNCSFEYGQCPGPWVTDCNNNSQ